MEHEEREIYKSRVVGDGVEVKVERNRSFESTIDDEASPNPGSFGRVSGSIFGSSRSS